GNPGTAPPTRHSLAQGSEETLHVPSTTSPLGPVVTVQVSRRRLRRFRASSTGPGPDRPERRTYRCRAWPRSLHRNAPRKTTRLRPETVSTPTPSGGP